MRGGCWVPPGLPERPLTNSGKGTNVTADGRGFLVGFYQGAEENRVRSHIANSPPWLASKTYTFSAFNIQQAADQISPTRLHHLLKPGAMCFHGVATRVCMCVAFCRYRYAVAGDVRTFVMLPSNRFPW